MKLKIVGNIVEFSNAVESSESNLRTAFKSSRKKARGVCLSLTIFSLCAVIFSVIISFRGHIFISSIAAALGLVIAIILGFYFFKNLNTLFLKDIDNEVKSLSHERYGGRFDLFEAYQSGNILSAKISQKPCDSLVGLRFAVDDMNGYVKFISILPSFRCSSKCEYKGVVELNLQKNTVVFYYKDELTEGEELELVNQWLPKSGDLCEKE